MYGAAHILVGGTVKGDSPADDPAPKPKQLVPFCYHSMNIKAYDELLRGVNAQVYVDLTCNDGILAIHSVVKDIPYFGVCFTEAHKDILAYVNLRWFL